MTLAAGIVLLLGSQVLNEMVDDFGVTQSAREHLNRRQMTTHAAAQTKAAAVEAAVQLNAAKKEQNTAEIERLTALARVAQVRSMQAEVEMNRAAALKEAAEHRRIALFYLAAGGLIASGIAALFRRQQAVPTPFAGAVPGRRGR